jgi:glycopeptide antibiotics resistance protein
MKLCMYFPLVVTLIITLPLDQVLKLIEAYLAVQYGFNLILFFSINRSQR